MAGLDCVGLESTGVARLGWMTRPAAHLL